MQQAKRRAAQGGPSREMLDQHPEWDLQIRPGASAAIRSSLIKAVNSLDIGSPPFDC
jgi:hypothetical protein